MYGFADMWQRRRGFGQSTAETTGCSCILFCFYCNGLFLSLTGVVFMSPTGTIVKRITKMCKVSSVAEAELLAVEVRVKHALQDNIPSAVILCDSTMVINSLKERKSPPIWSSYGCFWSILDLLDNGCCFQFSWIPRSNNALAHDLCNWARLFKCSGCF